MDAHKKITYTNSSGELQVLDPDYYKTNSNVQGSFDKYNEFQEECIRKFNMMYDDNYSLVNDIELTDDEKEYVHKTKLTIFAEAKNRRFLLPWSH